MKFTIKYLKLSKGNLLEEVLNCVREISINVSRFTIKCLFGRNLVQNITGY